MTFTSLFFTAGGNAARVFVTRSFVFSRQREKKAKNRLSREKSLFWLLILLSVTFTAY